jgi:putative tryptophan/tyrosine transport system substrate-binding protein
MRRRRLLSALAASAILLASQAGGQEPVRRVGMLRPTDDPEIKKVWLDGLQEHGYLVGRNLQVEYRYFQGRNERVDSLAAELIALHPEVIVTGSPAPALAIKAAAPTIPLVFVSVADPVGLCLVASLAHPGGNVTGVATIVPEGFHGKSIQLLKELVPTASRIAVLLNPANPSHQLARPKYPEIGRLLGVTLSVVEAVRPDELASAFDAARKQGAEAISVAGDPMQNLYSAEIVALAVRHRLPAIYFFRRSAVDGGLLSFGPDQTGFWRTAGGYVGRILNGERPADLAVQQPTKYQLVVNLKTAAALGITVPPAILAQADEVIE